VAEPVRGMSVGAAEPQPVVNPALSSRNRRTAIVLVAWILVLVLVSGVVAWLRN
jgi:hypothetical protein